MKKNNTLKIIAASIFTLMAYIVSLMVTIFPVMLLIKEHNELFVAGVLSGVGYFMLQSVMTSAVEKVFKKK